MHSYHLRVELHNGNGLLDYNILHTYMEKAGFSRKILSRNGNWYHLPPAEYVIHTHLNMEQVLQAAKNAAGLTKKTFSIFIVEYVDWNGVGLTQA